MGTAPIGQVRLPQFVLRQAARNGKVIDLFKPFNPPLSMQLLLMMEQPDPGCCFNVGENLLAVW